MKRHLFFIAFLWFLLFRLDVFAQIISISAGGKGGFYTLEYQQFFRKEKPFELYAGLGLSGFAVDQRATIVVPISFGVQRKVEKWDFFSGIGFSPNWTYYYQAFSAGTSPSRFRWYSRLFLEFGARRYFSNPHFSLAVSYTPLLSVVENFQWEHWGAFTFAYHFNTAKR